MFAPLGGFSKFSSSYPHLCSKLTDADGGSAPSRNALAPLTLSSLSISSPEEERRKHHDGSEPVQIQPHLFLGSERHSSDSNILERRGITHILNVTANVENKFEDRFHYKRIPINDNWTQDISSHFEEAIAFIGELNTLLIFCSKLKHLSLFKKPDTFFCKQSRWLYFCKCIVGT